MEKTAMQMVKDKGNLVTKFHESYGSFKTSFYSFISSYLASIDELPQVLFADNAPQGRKL